MNWINIVAYVLALGFIGVLIAIGVSEIKNFIKKINETFDEVDRNDYRSCENEKDIYVIREKLNYLNNEYIKIDDIIITVSNSVKRVNELEKQEVENADKG